MGSGIGGGTTSDNKSSEWEAAKEPRFASGGRAGGRLASEEVRGARETDAGGVEEAWREDVRFFDAGDLFAEGFGVGTI